eukprot:13098-Heterococcus_DN1.PRE.1
MLTAAAAIVDSVQPFVWGGSRAERASLGFGAVKLQIPLRAATTCSPIFGFYCETAQVQKLGKILVAVGGEDKDVESGRKKGKEDRFVLLKTTVMNRLTETCELMEKAAATGGAGLASATADPKAVIKRNQEIRANLRTLESDWTEMDALFQAERSKRRSKMTKDEMEARRQLLVDLKREVAELKAIHQQAAVGGGGPIAAPSAFAAAAAASDMNGGLNKRNGASEPTVTRAGGLTGEQHNRIQQIRERSKQMEDTYLSKIDEGSTCLLIYDIGVYDALLLQHSIQDRMLDDLGNRMDNAQGHLGNVNGRMKDVLKK